MADMPNDFWSGWVIVLTLVSFIGLLWLVLSVYFLPQEKEHGEEPVWDEDLTEGNAPPPLWWFWLLLSMMIFTSAYLMLYPGLGSFKGAFHWSQGDELHDKSTEFNEEYTNINEVLMNSSITTLQARAEVMNAAENIFDRNCSACHGYSAQGQASLFPNLRDDEWQWGSSPEQIEQTIRNGRIAAMISWQAVLNDEGIDNVSHYILEGLGTDDAEGHRGQIQYNQFCIACHGANGQGNPLFGAPSLINDTWLYGGSLELIQESISLGRSGEMPEFNSKLSDVQIKMLVAWLSPY